MRIYFLSIYMLFRLTGMVHIYKKHCLISLFVIGYLGLMVGFLSGYFITDVTVWAALVFSPYIIKPDTTRNGRHKYVWLSLVFVLLAGLSGVKTFYFLAIGTAILFTIESIAGPISYIPFFLLGLLSPTFRYFNNMLGFPVRLQLSEWAGKILQTLGYKIVVSGNVLVLNGVEFSVDPACVGLKMMAVSILAGLLMMTFFQQQREKSFSFFAASVLLLSIVVLNIMSNLIRILLLTMFTILPDNPNHDMVGIVCFLAYVILPSWFLIKWAAGNVRGHNNMPLPENSITRNAILLNGILFIAIALTGITRLCQQTSSVTHIPDIAYAGYSKHMVNGDIIKLEKPGILLYIKPMQRFYGAEHNPMICWVGSGYQFARINKQSMEGKEFYTGTLVKGTDKIYAAWWFDDGTYRTARQIDWRWRALQGKSFYLVNVNSGNENTLMAEVNVLLNQQATWAACKGTN